LGKDLSSISLQAAYTSDTRRALDTANLEAEKNQVFIDCVSEGLGGLISFSEMNRRLPDVAAAIQQHDTTGTAESFDQISERLKSVLVSVGSSYPDGSNISVVTHAFLIKTLLYLFVPASMGTLLQIGNGNRIALLFDGQTF
jgi:probable phosphoglycerate mutase